MISFNQQLFFFFLNDSYVSDPVPGTEDAFIDKS